MSINLAKEDANVGKIIYQWKVREYEQPERNRRWFITMGVIAILLLAYGFWTTNYMFVLIIALFGIILFLHDHQEPMEVNFAMTETGIVIGNTFYKYNELTSFWIVYNPPAVKNLYFGRKSYLRHRVLIPLLDNDPRPIKNYLGQYLDEDITQEEEPISDRLSRLFKL